MQSITGLGSETTILLKNPLLNNYRVEYIPTGTFVSFSSTLISGYRFGIKGKRKINASFDFKNRTELNDFLNFWKDRKGSFKRFWVPCWQSEFEVVDTVYASDSYIKIANCNLKNRDDGHLRIFIITKNEDLIIRKITQIDVIDATTERIVLDTVVPIGFSPNDVAIFGRVLLVRFADNNLEVSFSFADGDNVYATTNVSFIELPHEYEEIEQ